MDTKIEKLRLEDGRWAERHSYLDADGHEVVEMHVEPVRNLNLEKRIINKKKEVLAEQRIETIRDGQVVDIEVHSIEPKVLELREHIERLPTSTKGVSPLKDLPKDLPNFITKEDLNNALEEVVKMSAQSVKDPIFKAQSVVEQRVEEKNGKTDWVTVGLATTAVIAVVVLFFLLNNL